MQYFQILLQPQGVIQCGPESPGVSPGNEKLQVLVLNYRIFWFTYEEHWGAEVWLKDVHGWSVEVLQQNQLRGGLVLVLYPGQEGSSQPHCPDTNTDSTGPPVPAGQGEQLQNMTST